MPIEDDTRNKSEKIDDKSTSSGESEEEEDVDLEWEEWKPNQISFVYHMVAGSMAGLAEHVSIFPIGNNYYS